MDASDVLVQELDDRIKYLKDWLGTGVAKDFGDYQKVCGEIKGLLSSRQIITDLKQKMENSDE
jgi:hypothetical protein